MQTASTTLRLVCISGVLPQAGWEVISVINLEQTRAFARKSGLDAFNYPNL